MKKIFALALVPVLVFCFICPVFADSSDSVIMINGKEAPIAPEMGSVKNISGRTFVPVRFVLEYFGFNVTWDGDDKVVLGRNVSGDVFLMQVSNPMLVLKTRDDVFSVIEMDVSPVLIAEEGRTYIPVRFLAQAIGYNVSYDELTGTVKLDI